MKHTVINLFAVCFLALSLLCLPRQSSAILITMPDGPIVYDPVKDLYWYTDLAKFLYSPRDAVSEINIPGYSFHEASLSEVESLSAAISDVDDIFLFTPTKTPDGHYNEFFWAGLTSDYIVTEDWGKSRRMYSFYADPLAYRSVRHFSTYAWYGDVIEAPDLGLSMWLAGEKSSDPAPVPEPATLLLFSSGIAGLLASRLKKPRQ